MAKQITPAEMEILRRHLAKFPLGHVCPVCGTNRWEVVGIAAAPAVFPNVPLNRYTLDLRAETLPVVEVVCQTCFYVRHFAWAPILASYGVGENG